MTATAETPPRAPETMPDFSTYQLPESRADPSALFSCHSNLAGTLASLSVFADRIEAFEQDHEGVTTLMKPQIVEWSLEITDAAATVVITTDHSTSWSIPVEQARPLRSAMATLLGPPRAAD